MLKRFALAWALLCLIALVLAAIWTFLVGGLDQQITVQPPQRPATAAPTERPPRPAAADPSLVRLPALPPADAPLAETAATLQQLADAGHVEASCRLSIELLRCGALHPFSDSALSRRGGSMRSQYEESERRLAREGNLEEANKAAGYLLAYTELETRCAPLAQASGQKLNQYLRQAALGGAREARIRYAAGESVRLHAGGFGHLLTPEFDAWRREAPRLIQQAIEQGDPAALLLTLADQRGGFSNFGMLDAPSEARDLARLLLARRIFGDDPALDRFTRRTPVDESLRRTAEAEAAEWHARYFKGARAKLSDHVSSLSPLVNAHCEIEGGENCGWPPPTAATPPDCAPVSP